MDELLTKGNHEVLTAIFNATRDAIIILHNGKISDCNSATLQLFEATSKKELIGQTVLCISPTHQTDGEESAKAAEALITICLEKGGHFFEWKHKKLNGELFDAEVLLSSIEFDNQILVQAVVRDITERKELQFLRQQLIEDLRTNEEELRQNLEELQAQRDYIQQVNQQVSEKSQRVEKNSQAIIELTKSPRMYTGNLDEAYELLTSRTAEVLGITRVGIWNYDAERKSIICKK